MRVAFCGTGHMGAPMAERLLDAGHALTVWNRTPSRAAPLLDRGARWAPTPAEAARGAEAVVTMLADASAVRTVVLGPDGLVHGLRPGAVLIEMSTIGPAAVRALAERLPEGVELLDAPVKGGPSRAAQGKLRILVGGPESAFARVRDLLRCMGEPRLLGPLGTGAAAKVLNNFAVIVLVSVLGEAMTLADALGIDEAMALEILRGTPLASTVERQWDRAVGRAAPSFRMALAAKDLALALAALESTSAGDLGRASMARLERGLADGMGDEDLAAVIRAIRGR